MAARFAPLLVIAYFAGALIFLLRLSAALWGGHRLRTASRPVEDTSLLEIIADQSRRVGLKLTPVVAYCEKVAVPTVVGVLRPFILLPATLMTGLAPDQVAAVISHELAHIRRCDLFMNLLQRLVEALLFFHPVVWRISRRMSAEREACCDDLVVASGHERLGYAAALLRMAELCSAAKRPSVAALAASGGATSQLERRIHRLVDGSDAPEFRLTRGGLLATALVAVSLLVAPLIVQGRGATSGRT